MKIKRIIFFGTPEFSVETLKAVINSGYKVVAVVTVPDKPAGRGLKIRESDVKIFAVNNNLFLIQPEDLNSNELHQQLIELRPDVQIVVAFKKLPKEIFSIPHLGTINLHASLLPQYRGAAPINWAIINGEKESGVTSFYINEKIDEGNILLQKKVFISDTDTAGTLYDKLKVIGAELIVETLQKLSDELISPVSQQNFFDTAIKKAPKIQKADCKIRWDKTGREIINFIRGMSPYPGAYSEIITPEGEKMIFKVYNADFEECKTNKLPGSIETDNKTFLRIVSTDGLVSLLNIQLAGKVCMEVSSFLRGFQLNSEFRVSAS